MLAVVACRRGEFKSNAGKLTPARDDSALALASPAARRRHDRQWRHCRRQLIEYADATGAVLISC
jgi:hypothetical protein